MAPIAASSGSAAALGLLGAVPEALDRRRKRALLGLIFGSPDEVNPDLLDLMAREFGESRDGADADERRRALLSALRLDHPHLDRPAPRVAGHRRGQAPTMVLGGTADALVPARVLRQVLARRTDWQGHVLDDRRHALMMESPADYLDLLERWYADARCGLSHTGSHPREVSGPGARLDYTGGMASSIDPDKVTASRPSSTASPPGRTAPPRAPSRHEVRKGLDEVGVTLDDPQVDGPGRGHRGRRGRGRRRRGPSSCRC